MARLTSELVLSLVDRVTAPARAIQGTVKTLQDRLADNTRRLDAMRGQLIGAAAASVALARGFAAPVRAAMDFESAMADVRKVVDFPTPQGFSQMGLDIREMSKRMPMAAKDIAAIVAAAGQSGLAVKELLPFTEMAVKVGVAWEVSADVAGEALAKLQAAMGTTVAETGLVADAINHLGNNTAAAAPDILDMVKRVAASGEQFGFQAKEAAAFGAAMIGAGFESEVASTSFLNMGRALSRGASATSRQRGALKKLGLEATDVAKRMQKDAVGTVEDVLRRLQDVPDYMRASIISDFFGDEARALAPLITNNEALARAIALVGNEAEYAGSAAAEYAARAETSANNLQLFQNRITDLAISIGDALLPALNRLMEGVGPVVSSISEMAQRFPGLTAAIVGTTAALTALRIAVIAAQFSFLWLRGAKMMVAIAGLKGLGAAAAFAASPFGLLGSAQGRAAQASRAAAVETAANAAALVKQRQDAFQAARATQALAMQSQIAGVSMAQATANVRAQGAALVAAQGQLRAANVALAATATQAGFVTRAFRVMRVALIGTGIGAALVVIAAAGAWIYNNWTGITTAFEAFKGAFMRAIQPVMPALDPVIAGVSGLVGWVRNLLGPVDEMGGSWTAWGLAAGEAVGNVVVTIAGLPARILAFVSDMVSAGQALMTGLLDGIKAGASAVLDYVNGIGRSIRESVSGAASGAWDGVKNLVGIGGGGDASSSPAIDGARAVGGAIAGGRTYLVGEEGPELITPERDGWVHTADETAGMMGGRPVAAADETSGMMGGRSGSSAAQAGGSGGSPVSIGGITVTVHPSPGMDEEALARRTARMIEDSLRDAFSGGHWDSGYRVA